MPATDSPGSLDAATRGFRDLAMRRHAYYLDLLKSGRWRYYFSEQEFAERLRDVVALRRRWDALAGGNEPVLAADSAKSAA